MRNMHRIVASLLAAALLCVAAPVRSDAQSMGNDLLSTLVSLLLNTSNNAPPGLPQYYQPQDQQQGQIWQPGYWANGQSGYFWVPGTWVTPPQQNMLWTPGYWGSNNGSYQWNQGYWAQNVGYYGDVNYGNGYYGTGYTGGQWRNNNFYYNTAVSNVQPIVVRYVYIDRTVLVNQYRGNRISYHGGRYGIQGNPTPYEQRVRTEQHYQWTNVQQQHVYVSAQNRNFQQSVNHGRPAVVAVPRPFTQTNRPVGFAPVQHVQQPVQHQRQPMQQPVQRQPMQQPVQHQQQQPVQHQRQPMQQPVQHQQQPAQHQVAQKPDHQQTPNQKSAQQSDRHGKPDAKPTTRPELMY